MVRPSRYRHSATDSSSQPLRSGPRSICRAQVAAMTALASAAGRSESSAT